MSTVIETSKTPMQNDRKRGIGNILKTVRSGMRMTQGQLRFCLVIAFVLLVAFIAGMLYFGNQANNVVTINEEANILQDASGAERILSPDGKTICIAENSPAAGDGERTILVERITTIKSFWAVLASGDEIAAMEQEIGEGYIVPLKTFEKNSLWIMMASSADKDKCAAAAEGAAITLIGSEEEGWLDKGTHEDSKYREAYNNIQFIQFEKLGETGIRLQRQLNSDVLTAVSADSGFMGFLPVIAFVLFIPALVLIAISFKRGWSDDIKRKLRAGMLLILVLCIAGILIPSMLSDGQRSDVARRKAMIMSVDGAVEEGADVVGEASDQKFSFTDNAGNVKTVTIPKTETGTTLCLLLKYLFILLHLLLPVALVYLFRNERDVWFSVFNTAILVVLMAITLYPVLNTVAYSFNEGMDALKGGITVIPRVYSTEAYNTLLRDSAIYQAFWISLSKTIVITILNLFLTSMLAYALSRREFVFRKFITTVLVLTMYVNAGLIPNFLLVSRTLGLKGSYWVYIIPTMFSCFNMIVIRTYIAGLPEALVESARIDGAGDLRTFFRIILPLCTPVLATVALFVAVGSWNSWFDTYLYNGSKKELYTLQYLLKAKLATTQNTASAANATADQLVNTSKVAPVTVRAAISVVAAVPILAVYPFLQRYFVTGMALGSVKG